MTAGDARATLAGMSELTPYLCVADARAAIDWYGDVLGAMVTYEPVVMPDGRIGHVELAADGAAWMMSDEFDSAGVAAPDPDRGSAVSLHLTVSDVTPSASGWWPPASGWTAGRRTARPRAGSRCSATRSATAGSSTRRSD